ncbi:MAG: ABC transporter permease, partial [Christensenellales bacterium]
LAVFIVVFGALIVYAVIRALPSSYVETIARQRATQPGSKSYAEWIAQLNAVYGLDKGILSGFWQWLQNAVRGNFGDSWSFYIPVTQKFADVIWYSVVLNIVTFALQIVVCIPLGILAAKKQYSKTDYAVTVFALMGISLPSFFLATILKYIFSINLGWFDLYGVVGRYYNQLSPWGKILDMGWHLVLPILTLSMLSIGGLMRYTRTNMLEVLSADYIRTARAKGLPERVVINKHAFRNTLIPLVTYMSYLLPSMFAGSMITETLFQIPGIGYIAFDAMKAGDIPFTMFYSVFLIILTQVSLVIADMLYAVVDPRVRIN